MAINVAKEVATLRHMTVSELRDRYHEVFGEDTNARNKPWLIKRIGGNTGTRHFDVRYWFPAPRFEIIRHGLLAKLVLDLCFDSNQAQTSSFASIPASSTILEFGEKSVA